MKVRLLRAQTVHELETSIMANLDTYRHANFEWLLVDNSYSFEHSLELDTATLQRLRSPIGLELFDLENCITTFEALPTLTPYEARDSRLWTMLSHTFFLEHARERWPIPSDDDEATKHIQKHFFATAKRQIERDNVASRLWWIAYICSRVPDLDLDASLAAFLFKADVRANVIERPTTSQSEVIFGSLIRILRRSFEGEKALFERNTFRRLMIEINSAGGAILLDFLSTKEADALMQQIVQERLLIRRI